jgi:hypothetical protein
VQIQGPIGVGTDFARLVSGNKIENWIVPSFVPTTEPYRVLPAAAWRA